MRSYTLVLLAVAIFAVACGKAKEESKEATGAPSTSVALAPKAETRPSAKSGKALLVTQSLFKADEKGAYTVPDAAVMLILRPENDAWAAERVEDRESNVFHKALQYGKLGILTLGGDKAMLKLWKMSQGKWEFETIWSPVFGGEHNRLRDFEISDFDGDGNEDLAIATHDQGVVAVVWRRGDDWEPEELDRNPNTFVHEIEVGDLDGDGKKEIYATPSQPNKLSGESQGGKVVRFVWNGQKFEKGEVLSLETRHVKEIMVADVDADGKQELYAVIEAEMNGSAVKEPVEIRRFDFEGGRFKSTVVATLQDRFCRFLVAGDVDQDGKKEIVAAAFSTGVWVIEQESGAYRAVSIDSKSGGFEHAAYVADLEGDGKEELYVADDNGGVVRRYDFEAGSYVGKVINRRVVPSEAMTWNITTADL